MDVHCPLAGDLLIVGASARAAAQAASSLHISVIAADLFADFDLVSRFPTVRLRRYEDLIPLVESVIRAGEWIYTGGLENHPDLVRQLARRIPLLGNDAAVLRQVRDPERMYACFARRGLDVPRVVGARHTAWGWVVGRADDAVRADRTWLIKPTRSCGGTGIRRASPGPSVHFDPHYRQQYIAGTPHSAVYVGAAGRAVLLGVTRQLIGAVWTGAANPFQYCGSIGPLALHPQTAAHWRALGEAAADEFQLEGLFGIDAVVDETSIWPCEINPRFTASAEVLARAGISDVLRWHLRACGWGELPTSVPQAKRCSGKAVLFARHRFTVPEPLFEYLWNLNQHRPDPLVADIPAAGTKVPAGRPILTILADGPDAAQVQARLRALAAELFEFVAASGVEAAEVLGALG